MSSAPNIVVGSGRVYFNPIVAGIYQGYRYLAETPGFALGAQSESLQVDGSDGGIAERILDVAIRVTRSGTMTLRDISEDNLALFVLGDVQEVDQQATPVADEPHQVMPGRLYQLGASLTNPGGVRNAESVTITDVAGTTTYVAGTDYKLHAEIGMFEVLAGGGIPAGIVHANYTPKAETRRRVVSSQAGPLTGELKYVADNTAGAPKDLFLPACQLAPDGELALKSRENPTEMAFRIAVQKREGYQQVYIDGRATQ